MVRTVLDGVMGAAGSGVGAATKETGVEETSKRYNLKH